MSENLIYNTTTGGKDGENPKLKLSQSSFFHKTKTGRETIAYDQNDRAYLQYTFPSLSREGWLFDTWMFSFDRARQQSLSYADEGLLLLPSFPANSITVDYSNRWVYSLFFKAWVFIGSVSSLGMYVYIPHKFDDYPLGYCWFGRRFIFSTSTDIIWQGLLENMTDSSVERIFSEKADFSDGQCIIFFSERFSGWGSMIINSNKKHLVSSRITGIMDYKFLEYSNL
jgi:hypothetical protein